MMAKHPAYDPSASPAVRSSVLLAVGVGCARIRQADAAGSDMAAPEYTKRLFTSGFRITHSGHQVPLFHHIAVIAGLRAGHGRRTDSRMVTWNFDAGKAWK